MYKSLKVAENYVISTLHNGRGPLCSLSTCPNYDLERDNDDRIIYQADILHHVYEPNISHFDVSCASRTRHPTIDNTPCIDHQSAFPSCSFLILLLLWPFLTPFIFIHWLDQFRAKLHLKVTLLSAHAGTR